jgi:hypothetical protein
MSATDMPVSFSGAALVDTQVLMVKGKDSQQVAADNARLVITPGVDQETEAWRFLKKYQDTKLNWRDGAHIPHLPMFASFPAFPALSFSTSSEDQGVGLKDLGVQSFSITLSSWVVPSSGLVFRSAANAQTQFPKPLNL